MEQVYTNFYTSITLPLAGGLLALTFGLVMFTNIFSDQAKRKVTSPCANSFFRYYLMVAHRGCVSDDC